MKQLIFRLASLLAAAAATYLLLLYAGLTDPLEAGAVQQDKIARLHRLASPKVVIIGGSNVMFGIDSSRIQRSTGLPTVNMGVNAGISVNYMLEVVRPWVGRGDVVVLCLEHGLYFKDPLEMTDSTLEVLLHDPGGYQYLRSVGGFTWSGARRLLTSNSKVIGFIDNRVRPLFPRVPQRIYRRDSFDELGDLVAHVGRPSQHPTASASADEGQAVNAEALRVIEDFVAEVRRRGGRVVFSWPSIMKSQYERNRASIETVFAAVRGSRILEPTSSPMDYVFPDELFYDTAWHLTGPGRQLRTERLLKEISASGQQRSADVAHERE